MHGLIVGSPEKKRADPAVLRSLCSHTLPSGKNEVGRSLLVEATAASNFFLWRDNCLQTDLGCFVNTGCINA